MRNGLLSIFISLCSLTSFSKSANVLFVARGDSPSHRRSMYPLAEALAARGHKVTLFSEIGREDNARGKNFTENLILLNVPDENYIEMDIILNRKLWHQKSQSPLDISFVWNAGLAMTRRLFEERLHEYEKLLNEKWDLIVVGGLFATTGAAFVSQSKTPYILYDTTTVSVPESVSRSIPFPVATIPPVFSEKTKFESRLFADRFTALKNFILDIGAFMVVDERDFKPTVYGVAPTASLFYFYKFAQMTLVDQPPALDFPKPATPDMFFIGGKCKSSPLNPDSDSDWIEFVEDPGSLGTIVVAFGHVVKWDAAPDETKRNFAQALNKFTNYRVVWQFKGEPPVRMLSHVRHFGWLPQTELLNHANTKLFISHGGLKSIMESMCAEVPAIVIPFFAEQMRNALLFVRSGAGETMDKLNLTIETIHETIAKVLSDPKYKVAIRRLKIAVVETSPITPMENGIFWTEFVIRRQGLPGKWFKHKGIQMSWIKYFMIDVIFVLFLTPLLFVYVMSRFVIKCIFHRI